MKFLILAAAFSVTLLLGCSHVQHSQRLPAAVKDVGVIADGEVILYYKEGDFIIVKNCDANTILGLTPVQAKANCQGKSNKVPVKTFKQAIIQNVFSMEYINVLKPLTPEEVLATHEDGPSLEQIKAMENELDKINAFITEYGAENADLVRKEELVESLRSTKPFVSAVKKISSEVEKTLNLIVNETKLTLLKTSSDKDKFLYTVLKNFNPSQKFPCGLEGSVDERIKDCSYQLTSQKEGFVLVTRTKEFHEVHKQTNTGLLWGDRLGGDSYITGNVTHPIAEKACHAELPEVGRISGFTWRLPTKEEFEEAAQQGFRKALPNHFNIFWSSTYYNESSIGAWATSQWMFGNNESNNGYWGRLSFKHSVRCVTK